MKVIDFQERHIPAVKSFNKRLKHGGSQYSFPENPRPHNPSSVKNLNIYQKYFLVIDDKDFVRGGYILQYQKFLFLKKEIDFALFLLPISEGVVNPNYKNIPLLLFRNAFSKTKYIFTLGMGGLKSNLPKILKAFSWELSLIPFYFKIINIKNCLINIQYLRYNKILWNLLLLISKTGFVHLFLKIYEIIFSKRKKNNLQFELVESFHDWADNIWEKSKNNYGLIAIKDAKNLNALYTKLDQRFIILKINDNRDTIGWCVLIKSKLNNHKQFGNIYLGSIVDALCLKGYEDDVINQASNYLIKLKVDLIVSNQSSRFWCNALQNDGFMSGPSNFGIGLPNNIYDEIIAENLCIEDLHFNRGIHGSENL